MKESLLVEVMRKALFREEETLEQDLSVRKISGVGEWTIFQDLWNSVDKGKDRGVCHSHCYHFSVSHTSSQVGSKKIFPIFSEKETKSKRWSDLPGGPQNKCQEWNLDPGLLDSKVDILFSVPQCLFISL